MNSNRWLTIALVLSLGVNILIFGVFIGRFLGGPPPGGHQPIHLGMVMRHLDEPTREKLKPQLLQLREDMQPLRHEMRDAQRNFTTLLMQEPIDQRKIANAQQRLADASSALQSKMHEHMALTLTAIPVEQRQHVLRRMERRERRGGFSNKEKGGFSGKEKGGFSSKDRGGFSNRERGEFPHQERGEFSTNQQDNVEQPLMDHALKPEQSPDISTHNDGPSAP